MLLTKGKSEAWCQLHELEVASWPLPAQLLKVAGSAAPAKCLPFPSTPSSSNAESTALSREGSGHFPTAPSARPGCQDKTEPYSVQIAFKRKLCYFLS